MRSFLTGLTVLAVLAGLGFVLAQNVQIQAELAQLQQENSRIAAQLALLEADTAQNTARQQDHLAFRTAAESALRHLLASEITRGAPLRADLLHRVQADDSTTNSPFSILSEHFATKAYVDQQVAHLQSQLNNLASSGKGQLECHQDSSSGMHSGMISTARIGEARRLGYTLVYRTGTTWVVCRII